MNGIETSTCKKWNKIKLYLLIIVIGFVFLGCSEKDKGSEVKFKKQISPKQSDAQYKINSEVLINQIDGTVLEEDAILIHSIWDEVSEKVGESIEINEMDDLKSIVEVLIYYQLDIFADHYVEGQYDIDWAEPIMFSEDYQLLSEFIEEVKYLEEEGYFEDAKYVWEDIWNVIDQYETEVDNIFSNSEIPLSPSDYYETYANYFVKENQYQFTTDPYDYVNENIRPMTAIDHLIFMYWWDHIKDLFPHSYMRYVIGFDLTSDGWGGNYAMVWQDEYVDNAWHLTIDPADIIDENGQYNMFLMDETLVHEFAHILTLNESQMTTNLKFNDTNYRTDEGVLKEGSYLNEFYQKFWKHRAKEYLIESDYDDSYDHERLYEEHSEEFVTEYATTHPTEDLAESFIYFVTGEKPTGDSIVDQKIRFFYDYPELLEIRDHMRSYVSWH